MIKWKSFEQFKFGASIFSFLRLSWEFSETCSAQSLATCTGLNEHFLSSSSQEYHCGNNYHKRIKIGTVEWVMAIGLTEKCKILVRL